MTIKVDNAIIMAAGLSSRFAPLSFEKPKGLLTVKNELLIERQIKQLQTADINEIIIVTGYKSEEFEYLKSKFGVHIIYNDEYMNRNNNSSLYVAKEYLRNTYICSADNYFSKNPFQSNEEAPFYACVYADGITKEWCLKLDENDWIKDVTISGENSWIMMGHVLFDGEFSNIFVNILEDEYNNDETKNKLWEEMYIEHIDKLFLKAKKYETNEIFEFDTLDELREFDDDYKGNINSKYLNLISNNLLCEQCEIIDFIPISNSGGETIGFTFNVRSQRYKCIYDTKEIIRCAYE